MILIASAEQPQDPDSAEEETLYVDTEESESETDMMIIGGMTEIPSVGVSTNQNPSDIRVKVDVEGGSGFYIIPNGVYAFENVGNNGLWLDIQQDKYLPGYHMQQYAANGNPAQTFDRSCLFKITRRASTNSYIIRSMLNNRLTFYFSGNEVLTKEIPANDNDVSNSDTFKLVYNSLQDCFVIRPYSSSKVVAANNTTASGMAGAPNSYLIKSTETASGNQSRWYVYPYTGETQSGVIAHKSISTTNGIETGTTISIAFKTWTTEIGKNTPYLTVNPAYTDMVTSAWNATTYTLTVTPTKAGMFKLRGIIRSDGTTTAFRSYALTYYAIPPINGKTSFIQNTGTERYVDIEGPSKNTGAIIQQWQFNVKTQSKWLFEVQSSGYFRIKSQYSNKYIGVDSTDTTVIRQYDTSSDYTLWRFVETTSGNFKLICKATESSGNVLAVPLNANSNGTNLTMISYTDNTNYRDEWIIRDTSVLLAIDDTDNAKRYIYFTQTQTNLETKKNGRASIVSTARYSAATVVDMLDYLQSYDIFIVHTHGDQTGFKISNTGTKFIRVNNLVGQDLSNISFALLLTCNTGKNYNATNITNNTPVNIVEQMVICGAETVVGFDGDTWVSDCNVFAPDLTYRLVNEGMSIEEAIKDINYASYLIDMSQIAIIAGNEDNKLR